MRGRKQQPRANKHPIATDDPAVLALHDELAAIEAFYPADAETADRLSRSLTSSRLSR